MIVFRPENYCVTPMPSTNSYNMINFNDKKTSATGFSRT